MSKNNLRALYMVAIAKLHGVVIAALQINKRPHTTQLRIVSVTFFTLTFSNK